MCCFVNYILPKSADQDAVRSAFRTCQYMKVSPVDSQDANVSPSVLAIVGPDEEVWCRDALCDCDLPIGKGISTGTSAAERWLENLQKTEARYRKKGWSEARIQRALDDMKQQKPAVAEDNAADLEHAVAQIVSGGAAPYIRIIWHFYSGLICDEKFEVADGGTVAADELGGRLWMLPQDTILTAKPPSHSL